MNKPTIISYSRVSSCKQLSGTGLSQQKDLRVLNQLSSTYDLPIDERAFSDEGKSGFHSHNLKGEFGKIINLIESGSIVRGSILAITSLDRLSRARTNEAMELMLSVINSGIRIYTAMDGKLYCGDSQNLTADLIVSVIIMAQAHEESLKKSHRTRGNALSIIERHNNGDRIAGGYSIAIKSVGKLPWWIDSSDGSVKPDEYYFPIAKLIAEKMLNGVGVRRVTTWLNETYQAPNNRPEWSASMVDRFHRNKSLIGTYNLKVDGNEFTLENYFPKVMTDDQYYKVLAKKKSCTHSRTSTSEPTLLNGLGVVKCRSCYGPITHHSFNGYKSYRCINGLRNKYKCNGMSTVSSYADSSVLGSLNWLTTIPKPIAEDKVTPLQVKLNEASSKLNQVEQDYLDNPSGILAKLLGNLESDIELLRIDLESAKMNQVTDSLVIEVSESLEEKRDAVVRSINAVYLHKIGKQNLLVSVYFKVGLMRHYWIKNNSILKSGRFYEELSKEVELQDRTNFMLWVADGKLNEWLESDGVLDSEFEYCV